MRLFPFSRFKVYGNSMLPTLKPRQDLVVFKWAYFFSQPKIGDLVVIKHNNLEMVKRIMRISDKGYFVEGDNQKASTDSRSFGMIDKSEILGKVIYTGA